MDKAKRFLFLLLLFVAAAFAMSRPARFFRTQSQPAEPAGTIVVDNNDLAGKIKSAAGQICNGDFDAAEKTLVDADANDKNVSLLLEIISQYKQLEVTRQREKQKALSEQLAKLEELKAQAESNEPNIMDVFPVIIRAREFASEEEKQQILEDKFVIDMVEKAKKVGAEYESKGNWLDSLFYCYSWLSAIYTDDEAIKDKKKSLEEKAIIKASLMDNPCEKFADRYQKIKPEMFIRTIDVLEYGYVEPFHYRDMAGEAFKRFQNLAEVLRYPETFDSNFTMEFSKDRVGEFIVGLEKLRGDYSESMIDMSKDQFLKMFNEFILLNSSTMNLPPEIVVSNFSEACLSALDPHTSLIWPKEIEDFEKSMTNEFTGIGVEISKADGFLKAVSLLPGTPAYSSGIDAGDIIEAVNGEPTKEMSVTCAVSKITGPAGTKVLLSVRNPEADKAREIEITRARIIVPTTRGWCRDDLGNWRYFVDDEKIGYVRVTNFSATTAGDLGETLTSLESQGLKALILDLRFNTGGFLQSAAEITDMFVDKGIMVSTQPRVGLPTWEAAHKRGTHPNYPVVILINSSSASASEIVAGALADKTYSRATLVGEQSYGKGSVQTVTGYPGEGAQLKYTMAYYHLPDGSRVKARYAEEKLGKKDWGIMPNVAIKLRSDEIKNVFDIQRDNDVLAAANHDDSKQKLERHDLKETVSADGQLAVAILIAKTKLIESGIQP